MEIGGGGKQSPPSFGVLQSPLTPMIFYSTHIPLISIIVIILINHFIHSNIRKTWEIHWETQQYIKLYLDLS